jgi:hypothetical protein
VGDAVFCKTELLPFPTKFGHTVVNYTPFFSPEPRATAGGLDDLLHEDLK